MDLKVNQNTSAQRGEASAAADVAEFGQSFEYSAEAQLFEDLANAEGGESEGAESGESDDSGSGGSGNSGNGQSGNGSSQGQQRVLDYWSAQKEADDAVAIDSAEARGGRSKATGEQGQTLNGIPVLALSAEEQEELALAAESFNALSFLDEEDEIEARAEWHDDDVLETESELTQARETNSEEAGHSAAQEFAETSRDASELAQQQAEAVLEQGIDSDSGAEAIATGQSTSANRDSDSGQGRSRGEYIAMVDDEAVPTDTAQQRDAKKMGAQAAAGTAGTPESNAAIVEQLAEAAMEQKALRAESLRLMRVEELLAQYLSQREAAQEQQRREMLDALQQFQNRLNGLTQMAGQQGFMGAMMFMGLGGGFALSPSVDRRGLIIEKAKEALKGAGGKGGSKKTSSPDVIPVDSPLELDDLSHKLPSAEDEIKLSHEDLMFARKEAFRERFGQWLAVREETMGDEDDQMFIAHMLQSYDQFTVCEAHDSAHVHALWLSAMALIPPPDLLKLCQDRLGNALPGLSAQLMRTLQKEFVLAQNAQGQLEFDEPFLTAICEVSDELLANAADHQVARSPSEAFAIGAKQLSLPVVVVSFDGAAYRLLAPNMASSDLWCELQVWDLDWSDQRNLILLEGDRFRFLRRQF